QLLPEKFEQACQEAGQKLNLRWQQGYDHSYFTISSFIKDHIQHHAAYLTN
ncbi:MAG: S-formylglutathione hydrolase, partial [Cyanobacteria bacterium J06635_13]